MRYIDLHCDTLTVCADKGLQIVENDLQVSLEKLKKSCALAQCFAIFTNGKTARDDFEKYLSFYRQSMPKLKHIAVPIENFADFYECERTSKIGFILTVENLGFLGDDLDGIDRLKKEGVKMVSLVWNDENLLARPNLIFKDGLPQFSLRERCGLTPLGKEAVERLDANKIIVDISHLSDGGADDILADRKIPVVASHSNAQSVFDVSRNLSDDLIKKIAVTGGVIGVNFCKDFLGDDPVESLTRHVKHIINVGGEDVIAFGSDFDGVPPYEEIPDCTRMQYILERLSGAGIAQRVLEKLARGNFLRVFKEVCG
ncbi:MAG: hypothetical protein HDQ88_10165 [Clostridia bacterium]|nr:hypothetical protein [Clostridia bacterium]